MTPAMSDNFNDIIYLLLLQTAFCIIFPRLIQDYLYGLL